MGRRKLSAVRYLIRTMIRFAMPTISLSYFQQFGSETERLRWASRSEADWQVQYGLFGIHCWPIRESLVAGAFQVGYGGTRSRNTLSRLVIVPWS